MSLNDPNRYLIAEITRMLENLRNKSLVAENIRRNRMQFALKQLLSEVTR